MFLKESTNNDIYTEKYNDISFSILDALIENKIELDNIITYVMRLEHYSIINENEDILNEGIEESIKKFIERIKNFIDKTAIKIKKLFSIIEKKFKIIQDGLDNLAGKLDEKEDNVNEDVKITINTGAPISIKIVDVDTALHDKIVLTVDKFTDKLEYLSEFDEYSELKDTFDCDSFTELSNLSHAKTKTIVVSKSYINKNLEEYNKLKSIFSILNGKYYKMKDIIEKCVSDVNRERNVELSKVKFAKLVAKNNAFNYCTKLLNIAVTMLNYRCDNCIIINAKLEKL